MNIFNSKVLLFGLTICLFLTPLSGTGGIVNFDTTTKNKKELIIVNVDESLQHTMANLASYVSSIYGNTSKDFVTIKRYLKSSDNTSKDVINELVNLLVESGISMENIVVKDQELNLDHPYFTLSITTEPEIQ